MKIRPSSACCALMLLQLAACHRRDGTTAAASSEKEAAPSAAEPSGASGPSPAAPLPTTAQSFAVAANDAAQPSTERSAPPTTADAGTFAPLQSAQVKDAIYRAMTTVTTQRWKDGALSGYAVPSRTLDVYGCRAVSYTVDQLPDAPPQVINACH